MKLRMKLLLRLVLLTSAGLFVGLSLTDKMPDVERQSAADPVRVAALSTTRANVPFSQPVVVLPDGSFAQDAVVPVAVATNDTETASTETLEQNDGFPVKWVSGTRVNVRQGPSTDYGVVGQVVLADAVLVTEDLGDGWSRIRIEGDGVEGYIATRFLQAAPPG